MAGPRSGVVLQLVRTATAAPLRQQARSEGSTGRRDEGDGAVNGAEVEAANNNSATNGAVAEPRGTGF